MSQQKRQDLPTTSFLANASIGAASAAISKTALAPIDILNSHLINSRHHIPTFKILLSEVVGEEGYSVLFRGNTANVIRYVPNQALNFAFKDYLEHLFGSNNHNILQRFTSNLIAGGVAGSAALCIIYPVDYARTVLANNRRKARKGGELQYNSILDVFKKTTATEGIQGLYRGFNITCASVFAYRSIYFGTYDTLKPALLRGFMQDSFVASFILAYITTFGASMASWPLDLVRRRMFMDSIRGGANQKYYQSSFHAFSDILTKEGVNALFKGASVNRVRALTGAGVLAVYDKLQTFIYKRKLNE